MFFLATIIELVFTVSGISVFRHHRPGLGAVLVLLGAGLFLLTTLVYGIRRRPSGSFCGDLECGFLEGLACAECVDAGGGGGDCLDCGGMNCGN